MSAHLRGSQNPVSAKFVIAGGFGVGKTTFVNVVSEIEPLRTEASMTNAAVAFDDIAMVPSKCTTTVAMDFGRLTIEEQLVLYLFGLPGQSRFAFMWDDISRGSLGAIVLVDSRRLSESFPAVDYFERSGTPCVVVVNRFEGVLAHDLADIADALQLPTGVPVIDCDARDWQSAKRALVLLFDLIVARYALPNDQATPDNKAA